MSLASAKRWRIVNPEAYRRALTRSRDKRIARMLAFVNWLKAVPCSDCGGNFPPCAMDFDHVRGAKHHHVTQRLNGSLETLQKEVMKCDPVCANCHRVRTNRRLRGIAFGS